MLTVYFGTNRSPNRKRNPDDFLGHLNPESPRELRFGWAEVENDGRDDTESKVAIDVAREFLNPNRPGGRVLGSETVFRAIHHRLIDNREQLDGVLVYIHGFDYTFKEAVGRTAFLRHFYGLNYIPVLFSWPSEGKRDAWRAYFGDRDRAQESGRALARGILKLRDLVRGLGETDRCDLPLHLMVHSMGGHALRHAVQGMKSETGTRTLDRLFNEIILAAPDEDDDTFEHDHKLRQLVELGRRITVYHCRTDRALMISDMTKGNPDRLGSDGPKAGSVLPNRVEVVDCTAVADEGPDLSDHQYYRNSDSVRADIRAVLSGQPGDQIDKRVFVPQRGAYRIEP